MKLIVGLGNPGADYIATRHNTGFMALEYFALNKNIQSWKEKHQALLTSCCMEGTKLILAKPLSYMNLSGVPIQNILNFYKLCPKNLIVLHDDVDIPLGVVKIKYDGGHAGHNGLRSINDIVGTDYFRVRIGIGRPSIGNVASHVLGLFRDEELITLNESISRCCAAMKYLISNDLDEGRKILSLTGGS